jgi:hypothetical protein
VVASGTTMIEAASMRSPPPACRQVQSKMREFLKARAERMAAWNVEA